MKYEERLLILFLCLIQEVPCIPDQVENIESSGTEADNKTYDEPVTGNGDQCSEHPNASLTTPHKETPPPSLEHVSSSKENEDNDDPEPKPKDEAEEFSEEDSRDSRVATSTADDSHDGVEHNEDDNPHPVSSDPTVDSEDEDTEPSPVNIET